ncbi:MAG: hypothetical protein HY677_00395 [Chloroflexi bacterium]|nr:hypothetical protein [Chloroflexota bacterium]
MSGIIWVLALIGYGTAAVLGLKLMLSGAVTLFPQVDKAYVSAHAAAPKASELLKGSTGLLVGLFLFLQGAAVLAWLLM